MRYGFSVGFICLNFTLGSPSVDPFRIEVVVPPGPFYVGQSIEVGFDAQGGSSPPRFQLPESNRGEILARTLPVRQANSARYRVQFLKAGKIDLPPCRARSGDETAISKPIRLTVESIPQNGRTSAFLGGVGPFLTHAKVEPQTATVGQTLDFEIKIDGAAAIGSVQPPLLSEWKNLTPSIRVELKKNGLTESENPERTFRYRLRVLQPGRVVLPPVAVAAFDPETRRFMTRVTPGLPIQVDPLRQFDPKSILGSSPQPSQLFQWRSTAWGIVAGLLGALIFLVVWIRFRRRLPRPIDPRALARSLGRELMAIGGPAEESRAIHDALIRLLERSEERTIGAMTPTEAYLGVKRLTGDEMLALQALTLVQRCDRARFGCADGADLNLLDVGRKLFAKIAESRRASREAESTSRTG